MLELNLKAKRNLNNILETRKQNMETTATMSALVCQTYGREQLDVFISCAATILIFFKKICAIIGVHAKVVQISLKAPGAYFY